MTFGEWVRNSKERFYNEPLPTAASVSAETFVEGIHRRLGTTSQQQVTGATNIYDLPDWDVLILLDACHPAILKQVSRKYAWLDTPGMETYRTVGGYSLHWLEQTFRPEYRADIRDTCFVAWNPYTDFVDFVSERELAALEEVHEWAWSNELGCVPPQAITDSGIEHLDTSDRLICWYQQPHAPYRTLLSEVETLTQDVVGDESVGRMTVWNLLRRDEITRYEAIIACADMLRWCLDDVERLLGELDSETTVRVTADHGEMFGEHGRYGHPKINYRDEQLRVPLASVDLAKVGDEPDYAGTAEATQSVGDRLEALGYR